MGKLKKVLDDLDISEHALDGTPDMPSESDMLVQSLLSTISDLERHLPFSYEGELDLAIARLTKILERLEHPF